MDYPTYNDIVTEQVHKCIKVLTDKSKEYAVGDDMLMHFKQAARLQDISMRSALAGMMAKHTISIYDMCSFGDDCYPQDVWDEKITDHINYLLLLQCVIHERKAISNPKNNPGEDSEKGFEFYNRRIEVESNPDDSIKLKYVED